ncbi:MAG TPA: flagellar biosynthesis protein FlhB, partial [Alphaproteobacteria bacterium]|nr:flagellar biosynthesis protein FlhB [Alphaproteobacteria bacterium]
KRLQQAREKGDVPKSQEIPGWFVLASGLVVIALLGPAMARHLTGTLTVFLARPHELSVDPAAALDMISGTAWSVGLSVGFAFLILMGAGLAGHLVQTGLMFSAEKMKPKLSKLNPAEGVKRMLGPQGWANFLKGLGKMSLVALAVFVVIWPKRTELAALPALDVSAILQVVMENAIALFAAALVAYAFVAALDYMYQRQSFMKRNRMSR